MGIGFRALLTQVESWGGPHSRELRGGRWVQGLVDAGGELGWASFTQMERWALGIDVVDVIREVGVGFGPS